MKKTERGVWSEKKAANERERRHMEAEIERVNTILPAAAPKLREALEMAKGGRK